MTDIEMSSEVTIKLIRHMAGDDTVIQAAQVSMVGENNPETIPARLIEYLMKSRHGSPFEHNSFTFFVEAPIFVFREWHRHRISSINEMSGRYTKLLPKFYTPGPEHKLVNLGTPGSPCMGEGTPVQRDFLAASDKQVALLAWNLYEQRLYSGVSNELARTVLPVSIYSQMYWTVNARSLMNFISLRIDSPEATYSTKPQWEIQMGAEQIESHFAAVMPLTHAAFVKFGRVSP